MSKTQSKYYVGVRGIGSESELFTTSAAEVEYVAAPKDQRLLV